MFQRSVDRPAALPGGRRAASDGSGTVRVLAMLAGVIGFCASALALPAAGARLAELRGNPAVATLRSGQALTPAGYRRVLVSRSEAQSWLLEPRGAKELGMTLLAATRQADAPSVETVPAIDWIEVLQTAAAQLEAGLAAAPADPQAWTQLAWAKSQLGDLLGAATALEASYAAGPVMPELAYARTVLALRIWPWLADETRTHSRGELGLALRVGGEELMRTLAARGLIEMARQSMSAARGERELFEQLVSKLGAQSRARAGAG